MDRPRNIGWTVFALALCVFVSDGAFADGFTTYVESSANGTRPRSNAGLSVESDRLRVNAGVALRAPRSQTEIVPNLSSAFTIARHLDIETKVNLAEWNTRTTEPTFDTRLQVRSLGPFFDELEGRFFRAPDGLSKQILRLGFYQIVGDATAITPVTITGRAIFEATGGAAAGLAGMAADMQKLGVETSVAGLMSPFLPGENRLSLTLERTTGGRPGSASALAYDQAWVISSFTKLGVNLKFLRASYAAADGFQPSVGFTWRSEF